MLWCRPVVSISRWCVFPNQMFWMRAIGRRGKLWRYENNLRTGSTGEASYSHGLLEKREDGSEEGVVIEQGEWNGKTGWSGRSSMNTGEGPPAHASFQCPFQGRTARLPVEERLSREPGTVYRGR